MFKIGKNRIIALFINLAMLSAFLVPSLAQADDLLVIENIESTVLTNNSVKIEWQTNVNSYGRVLFGEDKDNLHYFIGDSRLNRYYHEAILAHLAPNTTYYYQVVAITGSEEVSSFIYKFKTEKEDDIRAPIISNLSIPYRSADTIAVVWKTNELSTSRIEYGEGNYNKKIGSAKKTTEHLVILKNLAIDAEYQLRIFSVDKKGNKSGYKYETVKTLGSTRDKDEDLEINNLRPSSSNDPVIGSDFINMSFKTNHYAKGSISLNGKTIKNKKQILNYNISHKANFNGLKAGSEYVVIINLTDVYGKTIKQNYKIMTKEVSSIIDNTVLSGQDNSQNNTQDKNIIILAANNFESSGYYGQYFNINRKITPFFKNKPRGMKGADTGWYNDEYLVFSRIDQNLGFGGNFFPVNTGLPGDPKYFTVHWQATLDVDTSGYYKYKIGSDDDSWVLIDGEYTTNLGGIHYTKWANKRIFLEAGLHDIDIYFAHRSVSGSHFSFYMDEKVKVHPRYGGSNVYTGDNNVNNIDDSSHQDAPIVAGSEYSYYSPASALLRTSESPDVYAIINGQRHYISSPLSFNEYGYKWEDIKIVSQEELEKYPRARLIKHPDSPTINYLYQRAETKWLKINLPSPTVFVSYKGNYWGNVIRVNQYDIDSYPDVEFIRAENTKDIYYLKDNKKYYLSDDIFAERGFNPHKIVEVNKVHFDSYKTEDDYN